MKNTLMFLLILCFSIPAFADVCICQYPKEDAEFGEGYRGEIGFYKMGCALWLLKEKSCRREKIMNINTPLEPYLEKVLRKNEKVRVGYVGHWGSSEDYVDYLKTKIEPLISILQSPIAVDNTACYSMEDSSMVQKYLETIPSTEEVYITVEGSQTTSIGMWDKVLPGKRKADLTAIADSRGVMSVYPSCKEFNRKRCTVFQENESGQCIDEKGEQRELICHRTIKEKRNGDIKEKSSKRWFLKDEIDVLKEKLFAQQ